MDATTARCYRHRMELTAAPDRMTSPGAGVLAAAATALGLLATFNALWHGPRGGVALTTEGFATIAWVLGWVLLVAAVFAAAAWLVAAIRDAIAERRASIINAIMFAATIAIMILAVIIAPLSGTGSAQA